MKGNEISLKTLNNSAQFWLEKPLQLLLLQDYGKGTVRNYLQELTLLFNPDYALDSLYKIILASNPLQ